MRVSELIEQLKGFEDFDVEFLLDTGDKKFDFKTFKVTGVVDIGYSDKVIVLTGEECE